MEMRLGLSLCSSSCIVHNHLFFVEITLVPLAMGFVCAWLGLWSLHHITYLGCEQLGHACTVIQTLFLLLKNLSCENTHQQLQSLNTQLSTRRPCDYVSSQESRGARSVPSFSSSNTHNPPAPTLSNALGCLFSSLLHHRSCSLR